jgi:hypothetical protein
MVQERGRATLCIDSVVAAQHALEATAPSALGSIGGFVSGSGRWARALVHIRRRA